jgi:H+/Cl- antiporter ClcA
VLKFIGGSLAIGCGLSLGREGPSIQLGAMLGSGVSQRSRYPRLEGKYLITSGASAGLAAAFNAPLAGVLFALEELHRSFSPIMRTCIMGASIAADLVSRLFFGLRPIFDFPVRQILPLAVYPWLIALGLASGLPGALGFLFTVLCYGSVVPGGIFFPMLVLGALLGRLYADLLVHLIGLDPQLAVNFVILGMAAFFTAVVRAPITGSILITERTGSLSHLLSLISSRSLPTRWPSCCARRRSTTPCWSACCARPAGRRKGVRRRKR